MADVVEAAMEVGLDRLSELRPAFRREASFSWFIIVAWGLLLRGEAEGVTSLIHCFGLAPFEYFNLLHSFHSSAFGAKALCRRSVGVALKQAPLCQLGGRPIMRPDLTLGVEFYRG